jgi:hypothetical protein
MAASLISTHASVAVMEVVELSIEFVNNVMLMRLLNRGLESLTRRHDEAKQRAKELIAAKEGVAQLCVVLPGCPEESDRRSSNSMGDGMQPAEGGLVSGMRMLHISKDVRPEISLNKAKQSLEAQKQGHNGSQSGHAMLDMSIYAHPLEQQAHIRKQEEEEEKRRKIAAREVIIPHANIHS